jgi:hypothetical protein
MPSSIWSRAVSAAPMAAKLVCRAAPRVTALLPACVSLQSSTLPVPHTGVRYAPPQDADAQSLDPRRPEDTPEAGPSRTCRANCTRAEAHGECCQTEGLVAGIEPPGTLTESGSSAGIDPGSSCRPRFHADCGSPHLLSLPATGAPRVTTTDASSSVGLEVMSWTETGFSSTPDDSHESLRAARRFLLRDSEEECPRFETTTRRLCVDHQRTAARSRCRAVRSPRSDASREDCGAVRGSRTAPGHHAVTG